MLTDERQRHPRVVLPAPGGATSTAAFAWARSGNAPSIGSGGNVVMPHPVTSAAIRKNQSYHMLSDFKIVIPGRRSEAEASPESGNHGVGLWIPGSPALRCGGPE
jgi:hypothetical protein